jgi:hypothetical protein
MAVPLNFVLALITKLKHLLCTHDRGLISRNASVLSLSKSFSDGISPVRLAVRHGGRHDGASSIEPVYP